MNRGEVWWCNLGDTIGSEQYGVRPCLIVQNNWGNSVSPTTIVLPMTKQVKAFNKTHVGCTCIYDSIILCEQIKVVDKHRLTKYICKVDDVIMKEVDNKMKIALGLEC